MCCCRCTSGCTCEARKDVDALHELRQSTIFLVRLLVSQAEECEISVTLSDKTRSEGHKFKVGGMLMNTLMRAVSLVLVNTSTTGPRDMAHMLLRLVVQLFVYMGLLLGTAVHEVSCTC